MAAFSLCVLYYEMSSPLSISISAIESLTWVLKLKQRVGILLLISVLKDLVHLAR